ncbi:MAG: RNA pseudouridine synthase [Phototrophicales bacterium]|nr:MAG: RNA pseudouridine synthase [Phototrophicales bacterium]RMG74868.1 MAG: RluA family pseudouridine synthase [Chloroflexota bacterium]
MEHYQFTIEKAGERLDKIIAAQISHLSRSQIQAMIKDGLVTVNGQPCKSGVKLRGGEIVSVTIPKPETPIIQAQDIPLNVIYEDTDIAVIDKPAGLVVHPGVGNTSGTLVNALMARWAEIAEMDDLDGRNGIVHRLDKDTSGLLVIAKNRTALKNLMLQFQERSVDKRYLAMLERTPKTLNGRIEAPIGRDPNQRKKMAVVRDGKEAITEFQVIDDNFKDDACLVEFNLLTGRTHQIRVHAAFIGCPIIGDRVYGFRKQRFKMKRNFLHAAKLSFDHPRTGKRLHFESELPVALKQIMDKLRRI